MPGFKKFVLFVVVGGLSVSSAFAVDPAATNDIFAPLSRAIDFTNVIANLMSVAASGCALLLSMAGVKKIFQFVKKV